MGHATRNSRCNPGDRRRAYRRTARSRHNMHKLPSFPLVIGIGRAPGHAGAAPLVLDRGQSRLPPAVANTPARIIGGGPDRGNANLKCWRFGADGQAPAPRRRRGAYHREMRGAATARAGRARIVMRGPRQLLRAPCTPCATEARSSAPPPAGTDARRTQLVMVWVNSSQVGGVGQSGSWLPSMTRRRSRVSICGASTCTSSSA